MRGCRAHARDVVWGLPMTVQNVRNHEARMRRSAIAQGGVAIMSKSSLCWRAAVASEWPEWIRKKIVASWFRLGHRSVLLVCLYGCTGATSDQKIWEENESMLMRVGEWIESFCDVPVVVMGDFQIATEDSAILTFLCAEAGWCDVFVAAGIQENTYEYAEGSSRIDLCLSNACASRLVQPIATLDPISQHSGLAVRVGAVGGSAPYYRPIPRPRLLPDGVACAPPREGELLDVDVVAMVASCGEAIATGELDGAWRAWTKAAATVLARRQPVSSSQQNKLIDSRATPWKSIPHKQPRDGVVLRSGIQERRIGHAIRRLLHLRRLLAKPSPCCTEVARLESLVKDYLRYLLENDRFVPNERNQHGIS